MEERREVYRFLFGGRKIRGQWEDPVVGDRIILRLTLD
jgi:hypothetical protein